MQDSGRGRLGTSLENLGLAGRPWNRATAFESAHERRLHQSFQVWGNCPVRRGHRHFKLAGTGPKQPQRKPQQQNSAQQVHRSCSKGFQGVASQVPSVLD